MSRIVLIDTIVPLVTPGWFPGVQLQPVCDHTTPESVCLRCARCASCCECGEAAWRAACDHETDA